MTREELNWNADFHDEIDPGRFESLVVYSRDWTVDTILTQIKSKNIDLNPKFQRRNAWSDIRRSRLIESLIIGIPVPEIVLAEDPKQRKKFLVIDGKQRLLTLNGFRDPSIRYWKKSQLTGLRVCKALNKLTYAQVKKEHEDHHRALLNADIRCTILAGYDNRDVLYDVFYRLNTTSVALSTQELRQVLHRGKFADFLIEATSAKIPIHSVLKIDGPDTRLRDAELLLRFMAYRLFADQYTGDLKSFLATTMTVISRHWKKHEGSVRKEAAAFNSAVRKMSKILTPQRVGRKYAKSKWEGRFNKALFEAEVYWASHIPLKLINDSRSAAFQKRMIALSQKPRFLKSIEATTKTVSAVKTRFGMVRSVFAETFKHKLPEFPLK